MQKLKGYIEQVRGVSYKPIDVRDAQSGVAVLRANNIQDKVDMSDLVFVDASKITDIQYLKKGDVLICASSGSKNLVGKAVVIPHDLDAAFGAFCKVVRIKAVSNVNPEFIRLFFLSKNYRDAISECSVGANINNIKTDHLDNLRINIPDYNIQCFAVEYLHKLQRAIDLKRKQLNDLDELVKSKFQEMFGDVMENEKGWDLLPLCSIGKIARGVSKHRPRNAPELLGNYMPLIQTGDIANSGMYISSCSFGYSELGVAQSKIWHKGTLCITIAANIGKCAIMTFDACFPDSVVGFIADSSVAKVEYVYFYFLWIQQALEGDAMGVAQKNINLGVLNSMNIPVPPIELQDSFIEYVKKVNAANAIINQEITNLEELLESKMDEYFGEKDEP